MDIGTLDGHRVGVPQRLDFHLLLFDTGGEGAHMIDFVGHDCRPATVLWVRPDQVHRYSPAPQLRARLVMFTPDFPPRLPLRALLDDPYGSSHWEPEAPARAELATLTEALLSAHDHHEEGPPTHTTPLLRVDPQGSPGKCDTCQKRKNNARVVSRTALNIRSGPGVNYRKAGSLSSGRTFRVTCKVNGSNVKGNSLWYKTADGRGWVAARWAKNLTTIPRC
ncbi:SH3 domain-containing protein [Streptomyces sp. ODS28]|uniref:SH3 domain-containing protein n=1 Tax=Streptomyces sp. ODS28 TaxID=3136688 RepID=UPI0031EBDEAF